MSPATDTDPETTVIRAPPEAVFEAWCAPEQIARWYVDAAEGDPRDQAQIGWQLGEETEPLAVTTCEPTRRLVLTNVSDGAWEGSAVDVTIEPVEDGTRCTVVQRAIPEALADHVPNVQAGWACTLALLKEHLEHHAGQDRRVAEAIETVDVAEKRAAEALGSAEAIASWAGQPPARVLATTPRGAVVAFEGLPGAFTLMAAHAVIVWYTTWGEEELGEAQARTEALCQALADHVAA